MIEFVRCSHQFTMWSGNEVLSSNACAPATAQGFDERYILSDHTHVQAHHTSHQLDIGSGAFVAPQQTEVDIDRSTRFARRGNTPVLYIGKQCCKQCGDTPRMGLRDPGNRRDGLAGQGAHRALMRNTVRVSSCRCFSSIVEAIGRWVWKQASL